MEKLSLLCLNIVVWPLYCLVKVRNKFIVEMNRELRKIDGIHSVVCSETYFFFW